MSSERFLIVNADDFGQDQGINEGIIAAHECGIVTSASLMVRWPAAKEATIYARAHPELSLGLHFDLGEWIYHENAWISLYEVAPADDDKAVTEELARQLEAFKQLVGQNPTHLDSHQHVHRSEPVRSILMEAAHKLSIPLRNCCPAIRYSGEFYGQTGNGQPLPECIGVDWLIKILTALPPGITELGCHPGVGEDMNTSYCVERSEEMTGLCDPRVRAAIVAQGITLCSFDSEIVASRVSEWVV